MRRLMRKVSKVRAVLMKVECKTLPSLMSLLVMLFDMRETY